ncbi:MAG: epimerase [Deltaproteobacteria bacterium]|nr:epimerase [Deltaproteobacteria bacterium]MBU50098.1 epimerase [Deltaproteobacteria bacterium]|tara:strand:+ start:8335 stop:9246 length:912 start_codon:yes stop_codon:yes gene_type:complete
MKVLITGISGNLGRRVAMRLSHNGHEVLGIDRRPWPDAPKGIEVFDTDIRKRPAEEVFRTTKPDAVIHMATVTYLTDRAEERYRINLGGTRAIFRHCDNYDVKHTVFVGRHTYYGAAPDAPMYHTEDDPPMAVSTFPELADLVAADLFAGSAMWRYQDMTTAVLRLCYILGPSKKGTLANYLKGPRVPTALGFDPLYQFIHEDDAAAAICVALEHKVHGVYNIAGPQPIPLSALIRFTERTHVPIPERWFNNFQGKFGLSRLPKGSLNHIKYPVVVSSEAFREATGFAHSFDEVQTMQSFLWS